MPPPVPLFRDRRDAGEKLAEAVLAELEQLRATGLTAPPIIYALPRGGLPVAEPIAQCLNCPLSVVVAKKITRPENPELAIGAVTADGQVLWTNPMLPGKLQSLRWEPALQQAQAKAQVQFERFSGSCPEVNPEGAIAILVDDGIATGMTIAVAALSLRHYNPAEIWLCTPVAPLGLMTSLREWGDRTIVLETPELFLSVSRFYQEFAQVATEEALAILQQRTYR